MLRGAVQKVRDVGRRGERGDRQDGWCMGKSRKRKYCSVKKNVKKYESSSVKTDMANHCNPS